MDFYIVYYMDFMRRYLLCFILLNLPSIAFADISITGIDDITFGVWKLGDGDLNSSEQFCVAISPRPRYTITASGLNNGGFYLRSGHYTVPYQVYFRDRNGTFSTLNNNVVLVKQKGQRLRRNNNCRRNNATLTIQINAVDLEAIPAGVYQDTLYLVVSPE